MIDQKTIDEIRARADIADIIGRYVSLKKKGRNFTGLCPFHNEKTPSFMVSPEKGIWHCFGCNKGGNVFSFLMEIDKIDFIDAVKLLADLTGVEIKEEEHFIQKQDKAEKNLLYELNEKAVRFFKKTMQESLECSRYIQNRGLNNEIIAKFELGFASDSWNALLNELKNYSPEKIAEAGLAIKKENAAEYYDRFRKRLIFPIRDIREKVIGFSGRIIEADPEKKQAKYVNTPDTLIFNKGNNLYGLYLAKQKIRETDRVILVEGQMDVIACHAAGVTNAVASLGTAFTLNQARLLARYTKNAVIAYDSDEAGLNAAERVIEILEPLEFNIRICTVPTKDLDELLHVAGGGALQQAIDQAKHYLEYKLDRVLNKYDITDVAERSLAAKEASGILQKIKDKVLVEHYLGYAARKINVSAEILRENVFGRKVILPFMVARQQKMEHVQPRHKYEKAERSLLYYLLQDPDLRSEFFSRIDIADFSSEWQDVLNFLNENKKSFDDIVADTNLAGLLRQKIADTAIHFAEEKQFSYEECLRIMQEKHNQRLRQNLRSALLEAERTGDEQKANQILARLQTLR